MPAQITTVDGGDRSFVPAFAYSPDRKGEHPAQHLEKFRGNGEKRQMARA
jgi:hypothetical protein